MDRFLIAPFQTGLQLDIPPWQIMDDAFSGLNNMYVYLGVLKKRFGSQLLGRLRINLGNTDDAGNIAVTVPGNNQFNIGQQFSIGTELFTVYQTGTPAVMFDTGAATTKTFDTKTGALVIQGAAALTAVYWYPALPVMGLTNYDIGQFNNEPSFAFDTRFAYRFNTAWSQSGTYAAGVLIPTWHGTNLNFFWADNWRGVTTDLKIMFVTNFQAAVGAALVTDDPIWSLNNTTWTPLSYAPDATQNPGNTQPYTVTTTTTDGGGHRSIPTNIVQTARIVVTFKNRLLLLNTIENNCNGATAAGMTPATYLTSTNTAFTNRLRYSINGSPFAVNAWLEYNQLYQPNGMGTIYTSQGAGVIDAPTDDQIVSAEFIKDRLIVFFDKSTWEIAYTGNEQSPFVWQKINTELGSQGPHSSVPFDKVILTFGQTGIHACNGSNVERIDRKIPQIAFTVQQQNLQCTRIASIRDYFNEMVYWSAPLFIQQSNQTYPGYALAYNYKTNAYSLYTDCITAFGYFYQQSGITWQLATSPWEDYDNAWDEEDDSQFENIVAGNQQGFTFICSDDYESNAYAMQITNITTDMNGQTILTIIDNTLLPLDFLQIAGCQGVTGLNGNIYAALPVTNSTTQVLIQSWDPITSTWEPAPYTGVYTGGGTVARVSQPYIVTKMWNPYIKDGRNVYIQRIDFGVLKTSAGQFTVDYLASSGNLQMLNQAQQSGAILGTGILETFPYVTIPFEQQQTILWHPVYLQTDGEFIQLQMYMNPVQLTTPAIANAPIQIQGMVLHTSPTSTRLQ